MFNVIDLSPSAKNILRVIFIFYQTDRSRNYLFNIKNLRLNKWKSLANDIIYVGASLFKGGYLCSVRFDRIKIYILN